MTRNSYGVNIQKFHDSFWKTKQSLMWDIYYVKHDNLRPYDFLVLRSDLPSLLKLKFLGLIQTFLPSVSMKFLSLLQLKFVFDFAVEYDCFS